MRKQKRWQEHLAKPRGVTSQMGCFFHPMWIAIYAKKYQMMLIITALMRKAPERYHRTASLVTIHSLSKTSQKATSARTKAKQQP
jgi:hypothetical protein